jgi:hypothetical protein
MEETMRNFAKKVATRDSMHRNRLLAFIGVTVATISMDSSATSMTSDDPDVKIRWDNTVKYSNAFRLGRQSAFVTADANADDGSRNFGRGLISNRVDWLSEFDGSYKNFGMRVSGAAWYDTVYNRTNDNDSSATSNNVSVPYNEFTKATRDRMGRKAELLDAFVYAKGSLGDMNGTIRLGRHSLLFGESLFFGANGIANAQGPIDLVKLLSVPGSQFKEVLRPVPQVSGQLQLTPDLSASAYYQFRWEQSVLPPAGSYLNTLDFVGEGAERLGPFLRGHDIEPRNSGQGGLQLRYRIADWDTEIGVFAARYHDKTPNVYLTLNPATLAPSNLIHAYAEGIRTFGVSVNKMVGTMSLAGEVSVRDNAPLVTDPQVVVAGMADARGRPAYAVGKTLHAQVSAVHLLETSSLWQGGTFLFEAAWNRRASISANPKALDPNTTRDAYAFRMLFAPAYYQVLPGVDVNVPIGLGFNPRGKSSAVLAFNGGATHGGDFSIGLTGTYENTWQFGANYVRFLGREGSAIAPPNSSAPYLSFAQPLRDRNFASLTAKRTF